MREAIAATEQERLCGCAGVRAAGLAVVLMASVLAKAHRNQRNTRGLEKRRSVDGSTRATSSVGTVGEQQGDLICAAPSRGERLTRRGQCPGDVGLRSARHISRG